MVSAAIDETVKMECGESAFFRCGFDVQPCWFSNSSGARHIFIRRPTARNDPVPYQY